MDEFDDEDERGFFRRYGVMIGVGVALLGAAVYIGPKLMKSGSGPAAKPDNIVSIRVPPPPPLPPPPPPPPPPTNVPPPPDDNRKIADAPKEEAAKPEPPKSEEPPPSMGSNIKGAGNDGFGLSGSGNGYTVGIGGNGTGGGDPKAHYNSLVRSRVQAALLNNKKTRSASGLIEVRIWPDASGRIMRAQMAKPSGNQAVDTAVENEALNGVTLGEPLPKGLPPPILIRLNLHRP